MAGEETFLLTAVLVAVELPLVVVEAEQVPVDGLVVEAAVVVPLVLFVVLSFSHLLVAEAVAVEVLTEQEVQADLMPIPGIPTMEELFRPLVVALVATTLPTVVAVVAAGVDQVDLLAVAKLDLIKIEVDQEDQEETPTGDLI